MHVDLIKYRCTVYPVYPEYSEQCTDRDPLRRFGDAGAGKESEECVRSFSFTAVLTDTDKNQIFMLPHMLPQVPHRSVHISCNVTAVVTVFPCSGR
jgi:hypothetical protein